MSNFFLIDRAIFDHPMFEDEPYSKRDAWTWLIANAAWKEKAVVIEGKNIILKRGQLSFSMRFMAAKWRWNLSKVQRYINRLQNDTAIGTQNDTGQLVITICNYCKYQEQNDESDTQNDTPTDNKTIRKVIQRRKNTKQLKEEVSTPLPPPIPETTATEKSPHEIAFDEFVEHRKQMKQPMTELAKKKLGKRLNKMEAEGYDTIALIDKAILNNWKGIWEPKEGQQ